MTGAEVSARGHLRPSEEVAVKVKVILRLKGTLFWKSEITTPPLGSYQTSVKVPEELTDGEHVTVQIDDLGSDSALVQRLQFLERELARAREELRQTNEVMSYVKRWTGHDESVTEEEHAEYGWSELLEDIGPLLDEMKA